MSSEPTILNEIALKNAVEFIVDNRGKTAPTEPSGIALIATNCVNNKDLYPQKLNLRYVSQHTYDTWFRSHPKPFDILLTNKGSQNGAVCLVPDPVDFCIAQDMVALRADASKIYPLYLFAALRSDLVQKRIKALNVDAVIPHLKKTDFDKLMIPLPEKALQIWIGNFYFDLAKRIELLQETNATLESIAQALFKSWFVDFDPVYENQGANAAALENKEQAPSLPPEIQALFPATFTDSPQGPIPEGWDLKVLYEVAEYVNGAAYKAFEPNLEKRGLPIIKIAELKAGVTDQTAYSDVLMKEKYKIDDRSILFSWSGNPDTSIDTFVWSHGPAWLNQHIFNVIPTAPSERSFVLMLLKHMKPIFTEIARDKQTTGLGHVTIADLKRLLVTIPEKQVLSHWNEIVDPIVERSFAVVQQMQNLVSLRDTLLPRLISGQLRLPEAEQAIAAISD